MQPTVFDAAIEKDRLRILNESGQEAADFFMAALHYVLTVPENPSASLVESALHMANTELSRQIANDNLAHRDLDGIGE